MDFCAFRPFAVLAGKRGGCTPLMQAASQNFPEVAEVPLEHLANVHKTDQGGFTPLLMAAHKGHVQVVNLLLQSGADVNRAAKARTDAALPGCQQWSQGSGGDAPRGWLRQDGGNQVGHRTVESTGVQPPRGRRLAGVNGGPLFFFLQNLGQRPKVERQR